MSPKYLVVMALNNLLIKRRSGGPKNQMNQSNNNIIFRPGVRKFLKFLYDSGVHIALFTSMYKSNAFICIKKLLDGKNTGMSIEKISIFAGHETTRYLENNNIQLLRYKTELISKVNNKFKKNIFDSSNSLIIDHLNQDEIIDEKINIYIPAINNNLYYDNWMSILHTGINQYLCEENKTQTFAEYMREFISIMTDIISSTM